MLKLINIHKNFYPGRGFAEELSAWLDKIKGNENQADGAVKAVRGIELTINKGEVLGLVGESGSGKSTLGRIIAALYKADMGSVLFKDADLSKMDKKFLKSFRRSTQIMFQDPASSLNPRLNAGYTVEEGLIVHGLGNKAQRREKVAAMFQEVGLPLDSMKRFSHEFSGGQRQRLSLARALSLDPEFLIADEPVSALDVSIQAQIVNLLLDLKDKRALTLLLISHDLPLVRVMADRIAVMYGGLLMEISSKNILGQINHHPYVLALWQAAEENLLVAGEPPDPKAPPHGCPFHPRCPEAEEICRISRPRMKQIHTDVFCACHMRG